MPIEAPILEAVGVGRRFAGPGGAVDALRRADLAVRSEDFVVLTGPSGSGKTTFLSLAALLDTPTSGTLRVCGRDAARMSEEERCRFRADSVGMIFQRFHLLPHRTCLQNVLFRFRYAGISRADAMERAREAMRQTDIERLAERPVRVLSSGEMQRVAIARAVAARPRMLLADEPTGNLDAAAARTVMRCFVQLHGSGIPVVLVTHNPALAAYGTRHVECFDGVIDCGG